MRLYSFQSLSRKLGRTKAICQSGHKPSLAKTVVVTVLLIFDVSQTRRQREARISGGTPMRSKRSTVSLSALPLPCATHVPPQARMIGSIAATSPLAGRLHRDLAALAVMDIRLAVGNDDDVRVRQLLRQYALQHGRRPIDVGSVGRTARSVCRSRSRCRNSSAKGGSLSDAAMHAAAAEPYIVDRAP